MKRTWNRLFAGPTSLERIVWMSGGEFVEPFASGSSPSPGTLRDLGPTVLFGHCVSACTDAHLWLRQLLTESRAAGIELQHSGVGGVDKAGGAIDGNTRDAP